MIELFKASSVYADNFVALDAVDLRVEDGEFVSIVGPAGAGKSTLLRLLTRELHPTDGKVVIDGVDLATLASEDIPLLRRKIGTIFQDFKLLSGKNASENVAVALEVVGAPNQRILEDVPKVLDIVGLSDKAANFPHELSGGGKQRLAIARALIHRPRIILADEPTGNLDMVNGHDVIQLLQKINKLGTTVVLVTHNREIVDSLARRVVTMERGRIIRDQTHNGKYII
jgi:cell division transport system ATP-binding protein